MMKMNKITEWIPPDDEDIIDEYPDHEKMTVAEFVDAVKYGFLVPYDGVGFAVYKDGKESENPINFLDLTELKRDPNVDYVAWYNR